ncbi:tryptophan synthase beta subunit-like PLP-dependent enzyme [Dipodascopsis tothii]|uniref:tryptophan synthase beta subunit-like PLP-dependent enzyme n=1 Tax=Dipodascopsis tothii TaxID=44089 RepID=UPI0034CF4198
MSKSTAYLDNFPTKDGYFGPFGGAFVPPNLADEMQKIYREYMKISRSQEFIDELRSIRRHFQGRPTPITYCKRLSDTLGGARIYLKREDLNHMGAHKLNHCMAEALLAKHLGKKKIIAETGAGQHGVALATAAAFFGLECDIYMGAVDIAKEKPNVTRMEILGAKVIPATEGLATLKEAVDLAFGEYLKDPETTLYCIGSVVGPHPFPYMVREFQRVVGIEAKEQFPAMTGYMPDHIVACCGGGSNAAGIFAEFIDSPSVRLHAVEPHGKGTGVLGDHAASIAYGSEGVMHGFNSIMIKVPDTNDPAPVHSIASGLDYPSVGPEHAYWRSVGRTEPGAGATDMEAAEAFFALSRLEGIIPALESAHAVAYAMKIAPDHPGETILVNLSGRGDKDLDYVVENYPELLASKKYLESTVAR